GELALNPQAQVPREHREEDEHRQEHNDPDDPHEHPLAALRGNHRWKSGDELRPQGPNTHVLLAFVNDGRCPCDVSGDSGDSTGRKSSSSTGTATPAFIPPGDPLLRTRFI